MILPVNVYKVEGNVICNGNSVSIRLIELGLTASFLLGSGHPTHGILSHHHLRFSVFSPSLWGRKTQSSLPFLLFASYPHQCLLAVLSRALQPGNLKHCSVGSLGTKS